jgi:CubicO group peptidase (beta-lactamase class C family)
MKLVFRMTMVCICLLQACLLSSCEKDCNPATPESGYVYRVPERVDGDWEVASLADVGMSKEPFIPFMNDLLDLGDHFFHGILIVKDDKLVFEEYFSGNDVELDEQVVGSGKLTYTYKEFGRNTLHFQGSANKSVISSWVGIAIDKGFITGIDETLFSFFPDYSSLAVGEKNNITIAHMLTMTSGLPWDDSSYPVYDPRNDEYQMLFNEDFIRHVLQKPLFAAPGRIFEYNSGTTYLLGQIVGRSSGMGFSDFAEEHLFTPLGVSSYRWSRSRHDQDQISTAGLYLRPRDMAKFGQMYMDGGVWRGSRIVSEDWVSESTAEWIPFSGPELPYSTGYGYQWWLGTFPSGPTDAFIAAGWGGQLIFALPETNMIVALTGGDYETNDYEVPFSLVNDVILPAVN